MYVYLRTSELRTNLNNTMCANKFRKEKKHLCFIYFTVSGFKPFLLSILIHKYYIYIYELLFLYFPPTE